MRPECPKPCIGGRVFWSPAEPQWSATLGYIGTCSHCGAQTFSQDLLEPNAEPASFVYNRYDRSRRDRRYAA